MQDIVYKLIPGLYESECQVNFVYNLQVILFNMCCLFVAEQKRREEFYLQRGEQDPCQ